MYAYESHRNRVKEAGRFFKSLPSDQQNKYMNAARRIYEDEEMLKYYSENSKKCSLSSIYKKFDEKSKKPPSKGSIKYYGEKKPNNSQLTGLGVHNVHAEAYRSKKQSTTKQSSLSSSSSGSSRSNSSGSNQEQQKRNNRGGRGKR